MRSVLLVFSLLLSGAILQCGAQSKKELFSKAAKQRHLRTKAGNQAGFTGKSGMIPDSVEHYSYDPFKKEYSEFPTSTDHFTYDQNGNVTEMISHQPPFASSRYTYVYSNGKVVEDIRYEWNASTFSWFPTDRTQVLSNQFGIDTAEIYSHYDTTNLSWIEMERYITSLEYDNQDRPIFRTYKEYDALSQTWTFDERVTFVYPGTDTVPSELYFAYWNGGAWINAFWMNRIEWGLGFRPDFEDSEITLTMMLVGSDGNWSEYFYDSSTFLDGNVVDYFAFLKDQNSGIYELDYSRHDSFDFKDNKIRSLELEWVKGLSDTSFWVQNDIVYGFSGEIREYVNRVYNKELGMEYRTKDFYYYGLTSLVSAEKSLGMIYPNPVGTGQKLFIQSESAIEQVQLYSFDGALLRTWNEIEAGGMDMQGISSGIYLVRLEDARGNMTTQRLQIR